MKILKIVGCLLLILIILSTFAGCGSNMSLGIGNYEYNKIHVDTYHYSGCLEVDKWYDNTTGVEVKLDNGQAIFLSEGTYSLIEDECPFCKN